MQRERQAHLLRFRGSAHPPGQDDSYDGVFLTQSEIAQKAQMIVGTPIWSEHNGRKKVGWVEKGSVGDDGRLIVDGVIDRDSFAGVAAARGLRDGTLKGLSLGINHLKMKDDECKMLKIVSKAIEEVSVTSDPDLPDTTISSVAPDSALWNLTRQSVSQSVQKHKTKTEVMKNRAEIERLRKEASARKNLKTMADQQQGAAATQEQTTPELAALMQKLDAQQKRMTELEAEKAAQQQELELHRAAETADDAEKNRLVAMDMARQQKLSAEMGESEQAIIDRITADIIAAGGKPNPELIEMIKEAKTKPDGYKPLFKYMKSQAGAAATQRATEIEAKYQAEVQQNAIQRKELEALRDRLTQSDSAQQQAQVQAQQQAEFEQRKAQYGQFVSGTADPTARKRARTDQEPGDAASSYSAASATSIIPSAGADVTFGTTMTPAGITFMPTGVQPAEMTGQTRMLEIFESVKAQRMQPSDTVHLLGANGVRPSHRASLAAQQSLFDAR